jgi:hypothetical protein
VQARLDGADRNSSKLLYFFEFIAFSVVQEHDHTMFVAELCQSRVEALNLLKSLIIGDRISAGVICSGQTFDTVSDELAFFNGMHALSREAALFIDKEVVHHTAEPWAGLIDSRKIVDLAVGLDEQLLEQIFRLSFAAREPPGKTVQAIEVWSHKALESEIVVCRTHNVASVTLRREPARKRLAI